MFLRNVGSYIPGDSILHTRVLVYIQLRIIVCLSSTKEVAFKGTKYICTL
jgi:hypothetical protein